MAMTPVIRKLGAADLAVAAMMNLMWGLNIIAVKMSVDLVPPMTAALLRQIIVLAVCLPMLRIVAGHMRELNLLGVLSGGIFYIVTNLSLAVSTNVSALAIAGQVGVPFSLVLAVIFLGERIHWIRIGGIALSLAGVGLLVFDPRIVDELPGIALTMLASFIWAASSLVQRRLTGIPVLTIYAWFGLVGTLLLLPVTFIAEPQGIAQIPSIPLSTLGWIAFSAIGSTVLGHGSMSWLLQRHPVTSVVPLTLGAPVIAVVAASLFFGTPMTPLMIAGGLIALAGVAIVTIRTAQKGGQTA